MISTETHAKDEPVSDDENINRWQTARLKRCVDVAASNGISI